MGGYTKLFNSILHSTIWREPDHTRLVWITMLAMSDRNGEVLASVPGLADASRVTLDLCIDALKTLSDPDEWSRTKDHEGRRIKEIDGGWVILNHQSYREKLSSEERREYNRRKQAEYRERTRKTVNDMSITVNHNEQCGHITEAEAEAEAEKRRRGPARPSLEELIDYANAKSLKLNAEACYDHYTANGWRQSNGNAIKDWQAAVRNWARREGSFQKPSTGGGLPKTKNDPNVEFEKRRAIMVKVARTEAWTDDQIRAAEANLKARVYDQSAKG